MLDVFHDFVLPLGLFCGSVSSWSVVGRKTEKDRTENRGASKNRGAERNAISHCLAKSRY